MTHYFKTIILLSLACLTAGSTFAEDEDTPLAKEMSAMNAAYRSLSKAFRSGPNPDQRAEYIAQVEIILEHAKASVELVPTLADTLAPEQKTACAPTIPRLCKKAYKHSSSYSLRSKLKTTPPQRNDSSN